MKRFFSFLFAAVLMLTMMPQAIGASVGSRIYWQDTTVSIGDSFSIDIRAENLEVAKSILLVLHYDESVLQLTGGEWLLPDFDDAPLHDGDWFPDPDNNNIRDGVLGFTEARSLNGALARFSFKAIGVPKTEDFGISIECIAKNGSKELTFDIEPGAITIRHTCTPDADGWGYRNENEHAAFCKWCEQIMSQAHAFEEKGNIPALKMNSRVCRICNCEQRYLMHGDINRNGVIESSDARAILRFSIDLDVPDEVQRVLANINADGVITATDARLTLRASVDLEDKSEFPVLYFAVD